MNAYIRAIGVCRPKDVLTNADLEKIVDTNDEWITTRTGIKERRIVKDPNIMSSDLATAAAQEALEKAGLKPEDVDGIILGTIVADKVMPATACIVQKKLGCKNAWAYDITAACSFVPIALNNAALMIRSGQAKNILIIGTEIMSRIIDWKDRNTCVLFGDGAGAMLISETDDSDRGYINTYLKSDGTTDHILYVNQPNHENPYIQMDGQAVFKMAVKEMTTSVRKTLEMANLTVDDVDVLCPHQANLRIMEATADRLKIPREKVLMNLHKYGNTSSATIPIALYEAEQEGKLKPGQLVSMVAIGSGMVWGASLVRW